LAALLGMTVAVVQHISGLPALRSVERWYGTAPSTPLQGDILLRTGMFLQRFPAETQQKMGVDAEDVVQSGIGNYERLALGQPPPSLGALLRLAVVYSRRGHPDEGQELLLKLVTLDEESADYYFAVSSVYSTEAIPTERLREARGTLESRPGWLNRIVLADYYRRIGALEDAAAIRHISASRDRAFAGAIATVALVYIGLTLVGLVLLLRFVYLRLFTVPPPRRTVPPFPVSWSPFDAVEVAAVLLVGVVLSGLLAGLAVDKWALSTRAPWALPLVALLAYLLFATPALFLAHRRLGALRSSPLRAVGLGQRLRLSWVLYGLAGYGVMLALLSIAAAFIRSSGLATMPMAARSATDLLQQAGSVPEIAVYFVLICVIAPVLEEVLFRGFIYAGLRRSFAPPFAVVLSAAMFALAHQSLAAISMVAVACVGILLAYLYERTRTLWPSIAVHMLHNLLAFGVIVAAGF